MWEIPLLPVSCISARGQPLDTSMWTEKTGFYCKLCFVKIFFQYKSLLLLLSSLPSPGKQKQTKYTSLFFIDPFFRLKWVKNNLESVCLITEVLFSVLNQKKTQKDDQTLPVETEVWQHICWIQYQKLKSFDRKFVIHCVLLGNSCLMQLLVV